MNDIEYTSPPRTAADNSRGATASVQFVEYDPSLSSCTSPLFRCTFSYTFLDFTNVTKKEWEKK